MNGGHSERLCWLCSQDVRAGEWRWVLLACATCMSFLVSVSFLFFHAVASSFQSFDMPGATARRPCFSQHSRTWK